MGVVTSRETGVEGRPPAVIVAGVDHLPPGADRVHQTEDGASARVVGGSTDRRARRALVLVAIGVVGAQWLAQDTARDLGEVFVRVGGYDFSATVPGAASWRGSSVGSGRGPRPCPMPPWCFAPTAAIPR